MGYEGANVLFDTWVHPLMMGLEEHLLAMFRDDFEFNDTAQPSHLPRTSTAPAGTAQATEPQPAETTTETPPAAGLITITVPSWSPDAEKELGKVPFFVRGKARRNTERFAREHGLATITIETLYDAKAHFSR
jgi:light-independent protochlorophyllide reductase subunit B